MKAFYRSPKTTFLAYFHVFAGNHRRAYHYNSINSDKDIFALGFELNFKLQSGTNEKLIEF